MIVIRPLDGFGYTLNTGESDVSSIPTVLTFMQAEVLLQEFFVMTTA